MNQGEDDELGSFASPPCFMHELDPNYLFPPPLGDPGQEADLKRWRKAERERLTGQRMALRAEERRPHDERIMAGLEAAIGAVEGLVIGAYWPFKAEPDLRPLMRSIAGRGGQVGLPVVVARGQPLIFRAWAPGDRLTRGVWNIPVPLEDAPAVVPDVVIAPVIGFDAACYRLGYGGGFYDRTLAARDPRPRVLGVGYGFAAISTIYPQWHDIPMDVVVTEAGIVSPAGDGRQSA